MFTFPPRNNLRFFVQSRGRWGGGIRWVNTGRLHARAVVFTMRAQCGGYTPPSLRDIQNHSCQPRRPLKGTVNFVNIITNQSSCRNLGEGKILGGWRKLGRVKLRGGLSASQINPSRCPFKGTAVFASHVKQKYL